MATRPSVRSVTVPLKFRNLAVRPVFLIDGLSRADFSPAVFIPRRIAATLRQPISVLLGLARITDLDIDVRIEPADEDSDQKSGDVQTGSTAHVTMSKLGNPMEYNWSDFKRVASFGGPKASN